MAHALTSGSNLLAEIMKFVTIGIIRILILMILFVSFVLGWRQYSTIVRSRSPSSPEGDTQMGNRSILILHSRSPYIGGAEKVLMEAVTELKHQGYHMTILTQDEDILSEAFKQRGLTISHGVCVQRLATFWFLKSPIGSRLLELMIDFLLGAYLAVTQNHHTLMLDTFGTHWGAWASYSLMTTCSVSSYCHFAPINCDESQKISAELPKLVLRLRLLSVIQNRVLRIYYLLLEFFYTWCGEYAKGGIIANSPETQRRLERLTWTAAYWGPLQCVQPPVDVVNFAARPQGAPKPTGEIYESLEDQDYCESIVTRDFSRKILTVGSLKPFKNMVHLIEAMGTLPVETKSPHRLIFCCLASEDPTEEECQVLRKMLVASLANNFKVKVTVGTSNGVQTLSRMVQRFGASSDLLAHFVVKDSELKTMDDENRLGEVFFQINVSNRDVAEAYHQSDIYVHLMEDEHYGIAVAQALVSGLEIVSVKSGNPFLNLLRPYEENWVSGRLSTAKRAIENVKQRTQRTLDEPCNAVARFFESHDAQHDAQHDGHFTLAFVLRQTLDARNEERYTMRCNALMAALQRVSDPRRFRAQFRRALNANSQRITLKDDD